MALRNVTPIKNEGRSVRSQDNVGRPEIAVADVRVPRHRFHAGVQIIPRHKIHIRLHDLSAQLDIQPRKLRAGFALYHQLQVDKQVFIFVNPIRIFLHELR